MTAYAYETEPNTPVYAGRKIQPLSCCNVAKAAFRRTRPIAGWAGIFELRARFQGSAIRLDFAGPDSYDLAIARKEVIHVRGM